MEQYSSSRLDREYLQQADQIKIVKVDGGHIQFGQGPPTRTMSRTATATMGIIGLLMVQGNASRNNNDNGMKSPKKRKRDIAVTYQYIEPKTEEEKKEAERRLVQAYDIIFAAMRRKIEREMEGDTTIIPERRLKVYKWFIHWFDATQQNRAAGRTTL